MTRAMERVRAGTGIGWGGMGVFWKLPLPRDSERLRSALRVWRAERPFLAPLAVALNERPPRSHTKDRGGQDGRR